MHPASMESPIYGNTNDSRHQRYEHYCAGCKKLTDLLESFACTNCIAALCQGCVEALIDGQRNGRLSGCPKCSLNYGSFKPFQIDLR